MENLIIDIAVRMELDTGLILRSDIGACYATYPVQEKRRHSAVG